MGSIRTIGDAANLLRPHFAAAERELLVVLCLSPTLRIRRTFTIAGAEHEVALPFTRIIRAIGATHAAGIVIAHNHPAGDCHPSRADHAITRDLATVCRAMGVRLLDHLIVSGDEFVSFRQRGWL